MRAQGHLGRWPSHRLQSRDDTIQSVHDEQFLAASLQTDSESFAKAAREQLAGSSRRSDVLDLADRAAPGLLAREPVHDVRRKHETLIGRVPGSDTRG